MAEQKVAVIITGKDDTKAAITSASGGVGQLSSAVKKFAAIAGVAFATKKIVDFGIASVMAFNEAEAAAERMAHILRTSTGATDLQISSLQKQADALEKVGVVGKEAILVGQGQLASFDLQAESIERLIPSILNYAVAERGMNLSGEELKGVTNGLAQALQGNFASLTKTGFILDETTKAMISNGTETEKVAALVKVLDSTYAGLNEKMRETGEGAIIGLQFAFDNLKESVGASLSEALLPLLNTLTQIVSDPATIAFFTNLAVVIGQVLVFAVKTAVAAYKQMTLTFTELFIAADKIQAFFNTTFNAAIKGITETWNGLRKAVESVVSAMLQVNAAAERVGGKVKGAVSKVFGGGKASGGPVNSGASYLVGEKGPEIFTPSVSGNIIPNGFGGGGMTLVINVSGNTLLDEFAGEKVANQIMQTIKGNLRL